MRRCTKAHRMLVAVQSQNGSNPPDSTRKAECIMAIVSRARRYFLKSGLRFYCCCRWCCTRRRRRHCHRDWGGQRQAHGSVPQRGMLAVRQLRVSQFPLTATIRSLLMLLGLEPSGSLVLYFFFLYLTLCSFLVRLDIRLPVRPTARPSLRPSACPA